MPQDWWSSHYQWADWHCTSCRADADHYACEHCGKCMAEGRDARYCSSTCRVYAWRKSKAAETVNDLSDGDTIVTHNSHTDRVAAETRDYYRRVGDALFGSPPKTEEEWSKSIQFWIKHESDDTALLCTQCHRDIGSEEPVWRSGGVTCRNCISGDAWGRVEQKPARGVPVLPCIPDTAGHSSMNQGSAASSAPSAATGAETPSIAVVAKRGSRTNI